MTNSPAISVIIPMYNTEKYIGECLDSLLVQTFKNFEVIVVDDCSTDSSSAIVESYIPKFGGRLTLLHTKKNSGNAAFPRNKGLVLSHGEYIYYIDSDDWITPTTLDELYTLAKNYDADVLYAERHFETDAQGKDIRFTAEQMGKLVDQPTSDSENLEDRVNNLLQRDIFGPPWNELVRRKMLVENEIVFPEVRPGDDHIWILHLFFTAKKFLRIPSIGYFWRQTEISITREVQRTPQKSTTLWLGATIMGLKHLDKILSNIDFFKKFPQYHYTVLNYFIERNFNLSFRASLSLPQFAIYEAIKQEFGNKLGEQDVLVSALCTLVNTLQKNLVIVECEFKKVIEQKEKALKAKKQEFNELAAQVQQVIDNLEKK